MQRPDNINDALRQLHNLTMAVAMDLRRYMDDDLRNNAEYLEDVEAAALDAHLLVTWIKDNIKEMHK